MPIRKRSRFSDYKQKHNTANKRKKRETETDPLREVRLENLRTHATTSRQLETVEQREDRLENLRTHATTSRQLETVEQREDRLKSLRTHAFNVLQLEPVEHRATRLELLRKKKLEHPSCLLGTWIHPDCATGHALQ